MLTGCSSVLPSHHPQGLGAVLGPICAFILPVSRACRPKVPRSNQCPLGACPQGCLGLCNTTSALLLSSCLHVSGMCNSCSSPPWAYSGCHPSVTCYTASGQSQLTRCCQKHLSCLEAGRGTKLIAIVTGWLLCWLMGDCSILPAALPAGNGMNIGKLKSDLRAYLQHF